MNCSFTWKSLFAVQNDGHITARLIEILLENSVSVGEPEVIAPFSSFKTTRRAVVESTASFIHLI